MKKIISLILSCIITISILPTTIYAASAPSAPTISSYTAISSSSIKIKWGSVSGATKYRVDRRRSDESDYKTLTSSRTATDYTDTGLKAGTKYYYRVYAINSAGTSKRSTTYQLYTMPDAPVISNVTRDSETQLTILWNKVSGATKYKIVYRRGDIEDYQTLTTSATGTSYTHKNLTSGSRYWYRVYAILEGDIGNEGDRTTKNISSERSETVGEFTRIAQPSVDNNNTSNINLKWSKTYGNSDYSYDIYRKSPTDSDFYKIARTKNLTYTDTGLTSGVIYAYKIITVVTDTGDICTRSNPVYAGPKINESIVLTPQSATSMKISWDKPSSDVGLIYTIMKSAGGTSNTYYEYATTSNTYFIDNNLTLGTSYRYYVTVKDTSGNVLTSTWGNSAVLQILPTSISLNKTSISINDGDTYKLSATIIPSNSTNTSTAWSSSNTNVATVSSDGTVTAKLKGSTTVTVKTSNGKYATCTVNVANCKHSYGTWLTTSEPTCEIDGSRYRTCSKCNETETETISALGHSYSEEWKTIIKSTCLNDGEEARVCTVCNAQIDNRPITKLEHSYSGEWITEKEPTCTEEGVEYRLCSLCKKRDEANIEQLEHNHQLIKKETIENKTTITEILTYKCAYCEDSYEDRHVIEKELSPTLAVKADKEYIKAGDTFSVSVSIENNPGFAEFALFLKYDTSAFIPLKPSGSRYYGATGEMLGNNGTYFSSIISNDTEEVLSVSWNKEVLDPEPEVPTETDISTDGIIFTVDFRAKDDIVAGRYQFSVTYEDAVETTETIVGGGIADGLGNFLFPEVTSTSVNIYCDAVKGDIDQNGVLNISDMTYLARHLVGWKNYQNLTDAQFEAGNVFSYKNEVVPNLNSMDGTKMMQLILGYTPVEKTTEVSTMSIASSNTISLFAESTEPEFIVGSVKGMPGEYVDVPVSIKNNSGLSGFKVSLNYDKEYLTPIGIIVGTIIESRYQANIKSLNDENTNIETDLENINVCWYEPENISDDGLLFTIRFLVSDTASLNDIIPIELSYVENDVCKVSDLDIEAVAPTIKQGSVQLIAETPSLQYEITDASAVSDGGTKYESIPVNGDFNLRVYVQNLIEEYTPATVYAAAYDSNERLISLDSKELTEARLNEGICSIYIDKSNQNISYIKVFIWDANNTLKPLAIAYDMH